MGKEIYHFIIHLRLHYQFFILSGGFLLGGFMSDSMNTTQYAFQFLNIHVLLFGGATAYNSWWDKDEGPVGGLKHPPKMTRWMQPASILFMLVGWVWSFTLGWLYASIYFVSLILFWLYSTPLARWKGNPTLSLITIAISTGFNSVLMGTIAAGGLLEMPVILAASGASLILVSMYPVSQIFQIEEDRNRGDRTFASKYGLLAVKTFFTVNFLSGLIVLTTSIAFKYVTPAILLFVGCSLTFLILFYMIKRLKGTKDEYNTVMTAKFIASLSFVVYFLVVNSIYHNWTIAFA